MEAKKSQSYIQKAREQAHSSDAAPGVSELVSNKVRLMREYKEYNAAYLRCQSA